MTKKIDISIIIATNNSGHILENTIVSLLNIQNIIFEIIIIDNLSSDNTIKIIDKYRNQISYFISECDTGIYNAWNKGLKIAKGQWISFIGADDIIVKEAYSKMLLLSDKNTNFISGKIKLINNVNYKIIGQKFNLKKIETYQNFCHIGSLTKREFFLLHGNFNEKYKISGDYEFYLRNRNFIISEFYNDIISNSGYGVSQNSNLPIIENYLIWLDLKIHSKLYANLYLIKQLIFNTLKTSLFG
jgi:glycosyltransferase involved in cell wall biosynthesis